MTVTYRTKWITSSPKSTADRLFWKTFSLSGKLTRFFNPRIDSWSEHFRIDGDQILPITAIGEATERIFAFNTPDRCEERWGLQTLNRYPTG